MKLDIVAEAGNDSFDFTTTNAVADKNVVTSAKGKMAEMRYRPSTIVISRWMRALRKGIFPSCHIATHGVRSVASVVFAVFIRKISILLYLEQNYVVLLNAKQPTCPPR